MSHLMASYSLLKRFRFYLEPLFLLLIVVSFFSYKTYFPALPAHAATNIDISGVIYDIDIIEFACGSDHNLTVRVRVNGAGTYSGICSADDGIYTVTGVSVNPNDVITIFVDDAAVHAVYVTKAPASPVNMTKDLKQDSTYLAHEGGGTITNADLDFYDSGQNSNIDFTVTSNNLTTLGVSPVLVESGTYAPGGTVSGNQLIVFSGAVSTLGANGNSVTSLYTNGGTFNINGDTTLTSGCITNISGTVTYTSGTPTVTCNGSSGSLFTGNMTFYNLSITNGVKVLPTVGASITIDHDFSIGNGVSVDQRGDLVVTGNLTTTGTGTIDYSAATPTTTVNGATLGGGSGVLAFYNLSKTQSGTLTSAGTGDLFVTNQLTVSAGTFVPPSRLVVGVISDSGGSISTGSTSVILQKKTSSTVSINSTLNDLSINDGLVGHYKLDETSVGTASDDSGFGNNGTASGSPTADSSVPTTQFSNPRSLSFNGTSQFVDLGNPPQLDSQLGNTMSLSAWIKPTTVSGFHNIVGKSYTSPHGGAFYTWSMMQISAIFSCRLDSTLVLSSGTGSGALVSGVWQHVACIYNGSTLKAYINGVEVGSGSRTGDVVTSTRNARIGGRDTSDMDEYFGGNIDDVRIYNRALAVSEVQMLLEGQAWGFSGATYTLGRDLNITGNFLLPTGTLDVSGTNYAVSVGGSFSVTGGIMTPQAGTVTLNGSSAGKTIDTGRQRLNNMTVSGSGGTWTLADRIDLDGTLAVSAGTLDVSTSNYAIRAATLNQTGGTIQSRSGTITLTSASNAAVALSSSLNTLRIEDPTEQSLAGYWKLDMGAGTSIRDASGNSITGTLTNGYTWSSSVNSTTTYDNPRAIDLDGVNDYVDLGNNINVDGTGDVTISGWFNRDTATTDDVIVAKRNGNAAGDIGYIVWIDAAADKLRVEMSDGTNEYELASNATFSTTGWHHFVATWDESLIAGTKLYIDGSLDSATATGTLANVGNLTNAVSLRIGAESDAGAPFDGKIDDIRIYTTPLSATQAADLGAGRYANGDLGTATFTASGSATISTLAIDSGTFNSSTATPIITNLLSLASGNGTYVGGSATQTLNGGLTVAASTFTGGSGILDVNGSVTLSGGTVTTGAGDWTVSGSFTHSGSTFTASAGNTLTMDGTGTLTSNGQTLQNLTINSAGTVTVASATHTVAGNLVLGGVGTPTVTGSTIAMTGTANTIDGGGKTLANLTIDSISAGTITLQNSDLTVSGLLVVTSSDDTLALSSGRTLTLSGNSGTTLTLNGIISGAGRLTYQNTATTLPTSGTLSSIMRFDVVNGNLTAPNRVYGGTVELFNGTSTSRIITPLSSTHTISGNLYLITNGTGNVSYAATTYNPVMSIAGDIDFTGAGGGSKSISSGTSAWTVGGNVDFTGGTFTATTNNTFTMTGSGVNLTTAGQTLYNLTTNSGAAVTLQDSATLNQTLEVASSSSLTLGASATLSLSSPVTLQGTITGAGTLLLDPSATIGATGTLASNVTFDATGGPLTVPTRTFSGATRTVTLLNDASPTTIGNGAGTIIFNGHLVFDDGGAEATYNVTGNNNVQVDGNVTLGALATPDIVFGSGTWTIGGNVGLANALLLSAASTTMNLTGSSKTLALNNNAIGTIDVQGSITATTGFHVGQTLSIANGATLTASSGTTTVSGDFNNSGTFASGSGTVVFDAGSTGHTIVCGTGSFNNLTINNGAGGWTIQSGDCTVGGAWNINAASSLTLESGRTVTVSGQFTNNVGGTATTWTGTTISLQGSGVETINPKTVADTYATLIIGASRQVQMWNTTIGTLTVTSGGGLMSYDHQQTDGQLYISGQVQVPDAEQWSYATDFDGVALGTSRLANIIIQPGSSVTVLSGRSLVIAGQQFNQNRTVIDRNGSAGTYALTIAGSLNASFFEMHHSDAAGLQITSTGTVSQLAYSIFDDGTSGGAYVTLTNPTSTLTTTEVVFDASGNGTDSAAPYAIAATGSGVNWAMNGAAGNRIGTSATQTTAGAIVTWNIPTLLVYDGTSGDAEATTNTSQLSANWSPSNTTYVAEFLVGIGTTPGGTQTSPLTNVGSVLATIVAPLTLVNGQTYYVTVIAHNSIGENLFSATSNGIVVDVSAPDITNLSVSATTTTAVITWTTDTAATSIVNIGLTSSLGTNILNSGTLVTSHSATMSGLSPNTTYFIQVQSIDQAGNSTESELLSFSTTALSAAPDASTPILGIPVYRRTGSQVTIMVTGTVRNAAAVRLYVDNKLLTTVKITTRSRIASFAIPLATKNLRNGRHSLYVRAVGTNSVLSDKSKTITFTVAGSRLTRRFTISVVSQYVVQRGDTLWGIARRYFSAGSRYPRLVSFNAKVRPSLLRSAGQILINWVIRIPGL